ncbi:hypothetical protein ACFX1Z_020086 [Malus domestica]
MIWDTFAFEEVTFHRLILELSIRPTEEFEGQNKSIKSRVRSTLLIWDTFALTEQMRYLPWKHKMLKMSTREQWQIRTRPKEKTGKKHDMGYSCF